MELAWRIALLVSAFASFAWGCFRILKKKTALFKILILGAIGCLMLGRLFELVMFLITDKVPAKFHIGIYAIMGGFLFMLSSSYGQMDGLVDDRSPGLAKYRLIPLAAPALILASGLLPLLPGSQLTFRWAYMPALALIGLASYYSLKHLIIPDVSFGIIQSIRKFSAVSLSLEFLYAAQLFCEAQRLSKYAPVFFALLILDYPLVVIMLEKGVKKWTI